MTGPMEGEAGRPVTTTREWKPGDVAMVVCGDERERPATYQHSTRGPFWQFRDGQMRDADISEARALVVIDPEDREQAGRLVAAWFAATESHDFPEAPRMQAALRSLVAPPRPEEPTGLGAVIEDEEGDYWVYSGLRDDDDCRWFYHGTSCARYADIAVVRVLSEGVAP